ncbi:MAG TPA: aldehyde dehydrogenase family protein, partial [Bacteroidales bacterium]|nr:aldehyde dehydrogenase family protein [Bacteroidales bacterium]
MNNSIFVFDYPANEPVKTYSPGTPERKEIQHQLSDLSKDVLEIPLVIGGREVYTGNTENVVMPHNHRHVLARFHKASQKEVKAAVEAALKAHREWESVPWVERVSLT